MPEGLATFNANANLQTISAGSAEALATLIRQIRVPLHIVSIVADGGTHTAYVRSHHRIIVRQGRAAAGSGIRPGQGEGDSGA